MSHKFIDIEKVIGEKAPQLRWLPNCAIRYLKRIVHEEEINDIFKNQGDLSAPEFAAYLIDYFQTRYEIKGEENLPKEGRCTFASNHPLGGMDGIILLNVLHKRYGKVKAPVNDLLMYIYPMREMFVPVNKLGMQSREHAAGIDEAMRSNAPVLYFPAGMVSRMQKDGSIADLEWKKSFASKSAEYMRDIVPIFFEGRNSMFFYRLAYYRRLLGIKANVEMLYLADELFKARGKKFTIHIGERIPYTEIGDAREAAEGIRKKVYSLENEK